MSGRPTFTKVTVPAGMTGIFACGDVSGCYGPSGLYMWGDSSSPLMGVFVEKGDNAVPRQVPGLEKVTMVKTSMSHIMVQCGESGSRKREAEGEVEEAKKPKVDA